MAEPTKVVLNPDALAELYEACGKAVIQITEFVRCYGLDDAIEAEKEGTALNALVKARRAAERRPG